MPAFAQCRFLLNLQFVAKKGSQNIAHKTMGAKISVLSLLARLSGRRLRFVTSNARQDWQEEHEYSVAEEDGPEGYHGVAQKDPRRLPTRLVEATTGWASKECHPRRS